MSWPTPSFRHRIFGPFAFDEASGELRKHGMRVRLQGQPLQILAVLMRHPGRLIARDEFQQDLWAGSTFVDFEHGLNAAMNRLRQVLGDSANQPRYIETVPGRGYRFIAVVQDPDVKPVLVMPPASVADEFCPSSPHSSPAPPVRKSWPLWTLGAGIAVGLAAGYLATVRSPADSNGATLRFSISLPDGYALEPASSRLAFALSPDGARLAFSAANESGNFQVFLRDLNALESRPLPNGMGGYHVFWPPDGHSLFATVRGTVRRYALEGDSYQVLCDTPAIMLTGALVGPNLMISARSANFVVPVSGGSLRAMKELYPWPQVLPDGKHLLYTVFDAKSAHHHARVVDPGRADSSRDLFETDSRTVYAPSLITPDTGYLVSVRAGNLLAHPFDPRSLRIQGEPLPIASQIYSFAPTGAADFSVSNSGLLAYNRYRSRSQLAWVDRHGDVVSTIGPPNINVKQGRLSPDGKKIAAPIYDVNRGRFDIWTVDTESGAARRVITSGAYVDNPVWAPDSKKLVYSRVYAGPPRLFVRGLGENDQEEPLPENYFQVPNDWSRDGRFVAFTNTSFAQMQNELQGDVWLVDMARDRKVIHLISTPFHEANPAFSLDGRWLAFSSDESGRAEVYVQAFEAGESPRLVGERHLVSRHGAVSLRWRADGKELFYLAWDGRIYAVPILLSPTPKIGAAVPLFTVSTEARAAIHALEGFDVSPDGQRFLVPTVTSSARTEIVVIQNWEAEALRNRGKHN